MTLQWAIEKSEMRARHILFQDEDKDTYIEELFQRRWPPRSSRGTIAFDRRRSLPRGIVLLDLPDRDVGASRNNHRTYHRRALLDGAVRALSAFGQSATRSKYGILVSNFRQDFAKSKPPLSGFIGID
jgi:hypothetical protein